MAWGIEGGIVSAAGFASGNPVVGGLGAASGAVDLGDSIKSMFGGKTKAEKAQAKQEKQQKQMAMIGAISQMFQGLGQQLGGQGPAIDALSQAGVPGNVLDAVLQGQGR